MDVTTATLRRRHALGMMQALPTLPSAKASQNVAEEWQQAFLRNKQRQGLYPREVGEVRFLGNKLFRTNIFFPANVPTGSYTVDAFLVRDGRVISAQTTPLIISKLGLEADIFEFAHDFSAFYGLVAVFLALVAGWIAHVVFRRN